MLKKDEKKTALELKEAKKRELAEDEEYFRQVDKPGGWKFVQQWEDAGVKQRKDQAHDLLTDLESKKNLRFTYLKKLAEKLQEKLDEIDWPDNWEATAIPTWGSAIRIYGRGFKTDEGLVLVIRSSWNKVAIWAIKSAFEPRDDFRSVGVLAQRAEDLLDGTKGILSWSVDKIDEFRRTKSGIVLP